MAPTALGIVAAMALLARSAPSSDAPATPALPLQPPPSPEPAAACGFAPHDWDAAHTLGSVSAATPAECCVGCQRRAGCQAGVLDAAGQCYLKRGLTSPTGCTNCTSCVPAVQPAGAGSLYFGPSGVTMEISETTLSLRNLSVSSTDGGFTQGFITNDAPPPLQTEWALWKLNITDCKTALPFGVAVTPCLGKVCGTTSHELSADNRTLTLRWERVPLPPPFTARLDVTVTVAHLPNAQPGVTLRGAVALSPADNDHTSGSVCLQTFVLPTLNGIPMRSNETDQMFTPDFFGHVGKCGGNCKMDMLRNWDGMIDKPTGTKEYNYMPNGNDRSMQWFAFYSNFTSKRLGLYAASHDAASNLQLALATGAWPYGGALHWYHIPPNPLAPLGVKAWEMSYEVVLQGFEGDWFDASQIYRNWAITSANWTRNGDVKARLAKGEFPRYLTTTPLLVESNVGEPAGGTYGHGAAPNDTVASMIRIMDLLHVEEMINWWSNWNVEFYDAKYPQFTARAGFTKRVKEMRSAGIHVVPYTNGRLFDPSIALWNASNASDHMCYSHDGPFREVYHTTGPSANISFFIADPADNYWPETFIDIAKTMKAAGVDGLYIDQLASYFPQPCFSRLGGNAAGSGWADGGRKLFSDVAEVLGPDTAVFSESNAEAYIGDLHGNMALYGWQRCGFVPAFQAVYSGWTVNAGIMEWPVPNKTDPSLRTWNTNKVGQDERTNFPSWMAYSAHQLVYGHIPGAMMTEDLLFVLENSAGALQFWRDMMQLRLHAQDYLVFGQMLRPPTATTEITSVPMCGNKPLEAYPCCPVPVVVAGVYKAPNGSVAAIVANIAEETVEYSAVADLGGGKLADIRVSMPPTSARAIRLKTDDLQPEKHFKGDSYSPQKSSTPLPAGDMFLGMMSPTPRRAANHHDDERYKSDDGASAQGKCTTAADRNLNGECTGGTCRCDLWWTGPQCSSLRLGPAKVDGGYRATSGAQGSSWGGTVVHTAGKWHLFASEWSRGCGLEYWTPNSRIVRSTADTVDGPFVFVEEVLATFYTNPQIVTAADGTLLMYVIGQPCNKTADCLNTTHLPGMPYKYTCRFHNDIQSGISLFSSKDGPTGPWNSHGMILNGSGSANGGMFNNSRTNPAPLVLPDGGVKLVFRGGSKGYKAEFIGASTAVKWAEPYVVTTPNPTSLIKDNLEDPFVYRDCRGGWHMLAHSISPRNQGRVGVHTFSSDGASWTMGRPNLAYTTNVLWADGQTTGLSRRERPVLVFGNTSGCKWVPIALINGALNHSNSSGKLTTGGFHQNTATFTLIQPVLGQTDATGVSAKTDDGATGAHSKAAKQEQLPIHQGCRGRGGTPTLDAEGASFFFGNDRLMFEFDALSSGLVNVTTCDPLTGSYQGFLLPSPPPPPFRVRSAVPLWQLSLSHLCDPPNASVIQAGLRMDGLSSPVVSRSHTVATAGSNTTATLAWVGVSVLTVEKKPLTVDVNVTVSMQADGAAAELRAVVSKHNGGFCLQSLALPNLEWTILRSRSDKLFVPHFFGHVGDLKTADGVCGYGSCDLELTASRASTDIYSGELNLQPNGNERSMQYAATWTEDSGGGKAVPLGLYLGAHDPDSRLQLITATGSYLSDITAPPAGSHPPGTAGMRYYHFPDDLIDTSPTADFHLPYAVMIAGFVGDWYDASMIHRAWALRDASWTKAGNLTTRALTEPGYPHWIANAPFWTNCAGYNCYLNLSKHIEPNVVSNNIALRKLLQINGSMALELAKWNEEAWDWGFPNFTARNTTAAATATLERAGVRVVPYTSGRLFDPQIPDWTADHAARFECVGVDGAPYYEKFEPSYNWSQRLMNPATSYWQTKVADLALYLRQHASFSGVYNDAVTAPPQACGTPTTADGRHATQLTGGSAWADGVKQMWLQLREKAGPGKMIMSESNAEAYIGTLHANLALYGFTSCGHVPAFQAVYADHTVMVGALGMDILAGHFGGTFAATGKWSPGNPIVQDRAAYRGLLAEQLAFGSQLGWLDASQILEFFQRPDSADELVFTQRLIQAKTQWQLHLTTGRLLRPPRLISTGMPMLNLTGSAIQQGACELAGVVMSAWAADDGRAIWLGVNHGKTAVNVTVRLRVDDAQIALRFHKPLPAQGQGWESLHGVKEVEVVRLVPALSADVVEL